VEGYAEYATWRPHLAYLRDPFGDPDMEMDLDGVGGVSILAKAKIFRAGVHFPAFSFEKHAETEGFGKVCLMSLLYSPSPSVPRARLNRKLISNPFNRWPSACNTQWSDCPTTPSGISTSRPQTIYDTWKRWRMNV